MKKLVLALVFLAALASGVLWFLIRPAAPARVEGANLLPESVLLFLELPDLDASRARWQGTSLAAIAAEPEMKAFMERPMEKLRSLGAWQANVEACAKLKVSSAFLGLLSVEGNVPRFVGGFRHAADRAALDAFLGQARGRLESKYPAGLADLAAHRQHQIRTFTDEQFSLAVAEVGGWFFVANRAEDLRATLDRFDRVGDPGPSLGSKAAFREACAALPESKETLAYLELGALVDRIVLLAASGGHTFSDKEIAEMRGLKSLVASTSFDGKNMRDTIVALGTRPANPHRAAIPSTARADTMFLWSSPLEIPEKLAIPKDAPDPTGVLEIARALLEQMSAKGFPPDRIGEVCGPGFWVQADWSEGKPQPAFWLGIGVRDRAAAAEMIEAVTGVFGPSVGRVDRAGYRLYSFAAGALRPGFALLGDQIIFCSDSPLIETQAGGGGKGEGIDGSAAFREAEDLLQLGGVAYAFLDSKAAFQRLYSVARPVIMMSAAFAPKVREVIDPGKLPGTDTVARHLGPIVYSQTEIPGGMKIESVGPITMNQFGLVGVAAAVAAGLHAQGAP